MRRLGRCLALLVVALAARAQDNVLVVLADDLGVDRVGCYGEHPNPGHTPNIDALAARGVLFRNAWSEPVCSPTRAAMLSGLRPAHTGIGDVVDFGSGGWALAPRDTLLPILLRDHAGWSSAALGKWHLGNHSLGGALHPLLCGFGTHRGSPANLTLFGGDYFGWTKAVDGVLGTVDAYATTATVDDALELLPGLPEPWFAWLAFNAPHAPWHAPPRALHGFELSGSPSSSPVPHVKAMIEALDTELGRLLDGLAPGLLERTTVVFVGDNGTHPQATTAPFLPAHAKGTVFEGGINVPLIVAGPRVLAPGSECGALVQASDLHATVTEIAGIDTSAALPGVVLDSVSLLPYLADPLRPSRRRYAYAESFEPNGPPPWNRHDRALRDERWKLIRRISPSSPPGGGPPPDFDVFFDLLADPFEQDDLLAGRLDAQAAEAYARLTQALEGWPGG